MKDFDYLVSAVNTGTVLPHWVEAIDKIEDERAKVEDFINNGGKAYGFTSLLGDLDDIENQDAEFDNLVKGHLLGESNKLSYIAVRSVLAIKINQLSRGGSGISGDTYKKLLSAFGEERDIEVNLWSSYGSGDVVPATWIFQGILGDLTDLPKGDFVALVNGSFIPAGILLWMYDDIFLSLFELEDLIDLLVDYESDVQLPVGLRGSRNNDWGVGDFRWLDNPFKAAMFGIDYDIKRTIEKSSLRQSFNPLFVNDVNDDLKSFNNSLFLDFELSLMLTRLIETFKIASAYMLSFTRFYCDMALSIAPDKGKPLYVQWPKLSKYYYDVILSLGNGIQYSQNESGGVEDISDGSLHKVRDLFEMRILLNKQICSSPTEFDDELVDKAGLSLVELNFDDIDIDESGTDDILTVE